VTEDLHEASPRVKTGIMDGAELSRTLVVIGWTAGELQRRLGVRSDTVRSWLADRRPIPDSVAEWLHLLRDKIAANPLPKNWE
jgi:hypothetical protein